MKLGTLILHHLPKYRATKALSIQTLKHKLVDYHFLLTEKIM